MKLFNNFKNQKGIMLCFSFIIMTVFIFSCGDKRPVVLSGHPYTHHIENNGYQPKQGDVIQYHFIQRREDSIIASTYNEGSVRLFRIPEIDPKNDKYDRITPITEAMMLMSEGDSLTLELLPELLPEGLSDLESGQSMFFDIKLVNVKSAESIANEEAETVSRGLKLSGKMQKLSKQYKEGNLEGLQDLDGIKYKIEKQGEGRQLHQDDVVLIHFSGHLLSNGKRYLDTYSQKRPYQVKIGAGRVIEAWEKLLPTLKEGDELYMFVPYQKAYGKAGSPGLGIPESSDLAIYMEISGLK